MLQKLQSTVWNKILEKKVTSAFLQRFFIFMSNWIQIVHFPEIVGLKPRQGLSEVGVEK